MDPTPALNAPQTPQPPPDPRYQPGGQPPAASPTTAVHHSLVAATGEQCPSCGHPVASDQRYCLSCGQRCGDPRLPFMNAVTFMDAMKRPAATSPPPPPKRRRLSPNAALIASVGTLLLAMGVGVLIGRSGNDTAAAPQQQAPIVIKSGAETESPTASTAGAASGAKKSSKPNKKAAASAKKAAESGEGAADVLHPKVKLAPPTVEVGGKCSSGAGCKNGEFTGEFFGE
ncbi:MAG TPA: hypothetical protein VF245_08155 [Solirubrobacterales bacterium]